MDSLQVNEALLRQRMTAGAIFNEVRPHRAVAEIPSAGPEFIKRPATNLVREEIEMAKKGTCPTCRRKNVSLVTADKCGRCYTRAKAGRDPVTNEPVPVVSETATEEAETIAADPVMPAAPQEAEMEKKQDVSAKDGVLEDLLGGGKCLVDLPEDLLKRMEDKGVYPSDVVILVEMLLDGRLRRVA